jgi:hypothetical protein
VYLSGKELIYQELTYVGGEDEAEKSTITDEAEKSTITLNESDTAVLAGNIKSFEADVSDFEKNRIVRISFTVENDVENEADKRSYSANYVMMARNEVVDKLDTNVTYLSILCPSTIYLEPGQEFEMEIQAMGDVASVTAALKEGTTGLTVGDVTSDSSDSGIYKVKIKVDKTVADNDVRYIEFTAKSKVNSSLTTTESTKILIRRVNSISLNYVVDTTKTKKTDMEGLYEGKGTVFTFYANVESQNDIKNVNSDGEAFTEYKSTKPVSWDISATIDGVELEKEKIGEYIKQAGASTDSKSNLEMIKYEVVKNLPVGFEFTVTATSKHQAGYVDGVVYNKATTVDDKGKVTAVVMYSADKDDKAANVPITGSITIKARETKITKDYEITLEPNEKGYVALSLLGVTGATAKDDDVELTIVGATDAGKGTGKTTATYKEATNQIEIKIGNNERGSGDNLSNPYTFNIKVKIKNAVKTIIVHVRRIDYINIVHVVSGINDNSVDYNFKVRINTMEQGQNDAYIKYLMYEEDTVENAFAFKLSWCLKNVTSDEDINDNDNATTVIVKAGVQYVYVQADKKDAWLAMVENDPDDSNKDSTDYLEYETIKKNGKTTTKVITYDKHVGQILAADGETPISSKTGSVEGEYDVNAIKPAVIRVYLDSTGKEVLGYSMKQPPQLDVRLLGNNITGVADDKMFVVKAEALHPYKEYNRTEDNYHKNGKKITAVDCIKNRNVDLIDIDEESEYIDVEPGQTITIPFYIQAWYLDAVNATLYDLGEGTEVLWRTTRADKGSWTKDPDRQGYYLYYNKAESTQNLSGDKVDDDVVACSVTIKIGEKEKGKDGIVKLTLQAWSYNHQRNGKTITIILNVRRVDEVSLSVADNGDINELNEVGKTITLEAKPTGYFAERNAYFKHYKKSDAWWDTVGQYEYKSPYTMEWYFVERNGTEHDIDWLVTNKYIEINTKVTEGDGYRMSDDGYYKYPTDYEDEVAGYKAVLSFKVISPIPSGQIKVKSLHSVGMNKTSTNYSGNGSEGVYGELTISNKVPLFEVDSEYENIIVEPGQTLEIPCRISVDNFKSLSTSFSGIGYSSGTKVDSVRVETGKGSINPKNPNAFYEYDATGITNNNDDTIKCYIKVVIDRNETGNGSGTFELNLTSNADYSSKETMKIQFCIRRVNELSLTVTEKDNKGNEEGSEVTIQACPKGYGTVGDEYFSKSSAAWDVNYKSPYAMKWTYVDSNNEEKDIKELANITVLEQDDATGQLSFTINEKLDAGIRIKATSVHSQGYSDGDGVYSEIIVVGDSIINLDLVGVESNTYEVKKGGEITIPIYVSSDDVIKLRPYCNNNYISLEAVSINGKNVSDKWNVDVPNSEEILTYNITIKSNGSDVGKSVLYIEIYKRSSNSMARLDTIEFNIKEP